MTHEDSLRETVCSALRRGSLMGQDLPRDARKKEKRQWSQIVIKEILTRQ